MEQFSGTLGKGAWLERDDVPMVSVVIPTYNCAQYIAETLQSVLDQGYPNLEIIVVDDGSIDNTRDVVTQFHSEQITYLYQNNSGGPSRPRNIGIAHAQGQFIALCDSDDVMLPGKIQAAVEFLEMNSQLGLMFTNYVKCDERGTPYPNPFLDGYHHFWMCQKRQVDDQLYIISASVAYETLIKQNYIGTSSVVIPKSVFFEVGEFDETLSGPEDLDMWLRITSVYEIGFINMLGHRYRVRNHGITARGDGRLIPHGIRVYRKQLERTLPGIVRRKVHQKLSNRLWALGYCHQSVGEMRQARVNYWLSLREAVSWRAVRGILVSLLGRRIVALLRDCRAKRDNTNERIKNL